MSQHARYTHEQKRDFARQMRKEPTEAERQLWHHLRGNAIGHKFLRQAQVAGYIVDFYCQPLRVAIEVDGSIHENLIIAARDAEKERVLEERGICVLRFLNQDVMAFPTVVINRIITVCDERRALKALSGAVVGEGKRKPAAVVGAVENADWTPKEKTNLHLIVESTAGNSVGTPVTAEDLKAVNEAWRKVVRRSVAQYHLSMADSATDQKLRLAEWLKKRADSAALTFKGIDVRQA